MPNQALFNQPSDFKLPESCEFSRHGQAEEDRWSFLGNPKGSEDPISFVPSPDSKCQAAVGGLAGVDSTVNQALDTCYKTLFPPRGFSKGPLL